MDTIVDGIGLALSWQALLAIVAGLAAGQVLGAIPGLTASMAVAILIPYTYYFSPWVGIPMLIAMFKGALFGGSISAVLLRTPGTPAAAATVADGHALAMQGKGGKALNMALYASVFGDTFSDICLIFAAGALALIAVRFGPPEYALLIIFSLLTLGSLSGREVWKGLASALVGLLLATVGFDPMEGTERLTFGFLSLLDGFQLIPVLIGLLAVSEILIQLEKPAAELALKALVPSGRPEDSRVSWAEFRSQMPVLVKSSILGTLIGAMPGLGATVAAFLAYNEAQRASPHPERFGTGVLEGVSAPESANNAVSGANLIPLLAFGIPGDVAAALILGAFMIQGITPGPLVFRENPVEIYAIFASLIIANLLNLVIGKGLIYTAVGALKIPKRLLFPAVLVLAVAGSYAIRGSSFDVVVVVGFGILGYVLTKLNVPLVPLIIGFILGPILEVALRRTLILVSPEDNWLMYFASRPIFLVLFVVLAVLGGLLLRRRSEMIGIERHPEVERPSE